MSQQGRPSGEMSPGNFGNNNWVITQHHGCLGAGREQCAAEEDNLKGIFETRNVNHQIVCLEKEGTELMENTSLSSWSDVSSGTSDKTRSPETHISDSFTSHGYFICSSLFPFITAFCCRGWDAGFVAQEKVLLEGNCFLISGEYQTSLRLMSTLPPFYSDEMMEQLNCFVFGCKGKWGILLPCIIDRACQGNVKDKSWTKEVPCQKEQGLGLCLVWVHPWLLFLVAVY